MGEVIPFRRRVPVREVRERPTVAAARAADPELYADLVVLAWRGVAHRVDQHMTELMRVGIDAADRARADRTAIRRIGPASVWTYCGNWGSPDPPEPNTLVCLRCCPWWWA